MKKAILSSILMALCIMALAQAPESFNYQVVMRDGTNNPLQNQNVSFRMSILKGGASGDPVYTEYHSASTGELGIVSLVIGDGTDKVGTISSIDWGADTYFLKVMIDKTGGTTYVEMGTTQLLSVPYAMYAKTADFNSLLNKPTIINSQWTSTGNNIYFNTGKVGIGTTPSDYTLTVDGRARLRPGEEGTAGILYTTEENNNIGFIGAAGNNHLGIWGSGGGGFGLVMDATSLNVGIGTTTPATKLEVNGQVKITGGTPASGQVLTSDDTGLASWEPVPAPAVNQTYFEVKRDVAYEWPDNGTIQKIDFSTGSTVWENMGNAFDAPTSTFTAPEDGIYSFKGSINFTVLTTGSLVYAYLKAGDKNYYGDWGYTGGSSEIVNISITLYLSKGQTAQLWGYVSDPTPPSSVYGNPSNYAFTYFSGAKVH